MKKRKTNLYDRHQNKKALAKKARAKGKHFSKIDFNKEFEEVCKIYKENSFTGRVINVISKKIYVYYCDDIYICTLDKSFFNQSIVVGDIVDFFIKEDIIEKKNIIFYLHKRKSFLARIKGDSTRFSILGYDKQIVTSNVDLGLIVASTVSPKFHPNLIDRYLIMCEIGNVKPIICINKVDLIEDKHPIIEYYKTKLKIPVIKISCITGEGFIELTEILKNNISVLMGNSGVGKTSIINYLNNKLNLKTKSISFKNNEGQHTTTTTTLYKWENNSFIIDTPGIRNLNLFFIKKEELKKYFFEFRDFEEKCKFPDCIHLNEPNCAIKKAVESGLINRYRYNSYINIINEGLH